MRLEQGRAIVTLKLKEGSVPVYRDASVLLRPKTGLKDMVAELTPGTPEAGELPADERIPIGQTLPDVNLDEILAALDGDTRAYLVMLLSGGAEGLRGNSSELANTIRRFEPLARDSRKISEQLATRRKNIQRVIHNFSLLSEALGDKDQALGEFVENSNAVFAALADQDAALRASLQELPPALDATTDALTSVDAMASVLGPTLEDLRPGRPRARPVARADPAVPDDDDADPARRDPPVRAPGARAGAPAASPRSSDLSAATPDLVNTFRVVNTLLDALAYNPPGERDEGYLFWASWVNHLGPAVFSNADAHGPIRRGLVVVGCNSLRTLQSVVLGNPQLGVLTQLLEVPVDRRGLPAARRCDRLMQKSAPSFARIAAMVLFALSCFGLVLFLWLAFGGPVPLKPKGYRVTASFAEAALARHGGRRADLGRAGRHGQVDRGRHGDGPLRRDLRARRRSTRRCPRTRRRSCARRRCWARPTSSSRPARRRRRSWPRAAASPRGRSPRPSSSTRSCARSSRRRARPSRSGCSPRPRRSTATGATSTTRWATSARSPTTPRSSSTSSTGRSRRCSG